MTRIRLCSSSKRSDRCGFRLLAVLILIVLPAIASALEFAPLTYIRAFSPNGDGLRDSTIIVVEVSDAAATVDSLFLGIYAEAAVPPSPSALLAYPAPDSLTSEGSDQLLRAYYTWWGRAGEDGPSDPLLDDGFYYIHALALAGEDSLWLQVPYQLELNTIAPTLYSLAMEPSEYFTPRQFGADTLLQVFFQSEEFDTLTDDARVRIFREDPDTGAWQDIGTILRDPDYFLIVDDVPRYRLLWNGEDNEGALADGRYRLDLTLSDEAWNQPATASLIINLDDSSPALTVVDFGGPLETGALNFTVRPDALPESLVVRGRDRNSVASCVAALDSTVIFDQEGRLLPESGFEEVFFSFQLPQTWGSPEDEETNHYLYLDGLDLAGNTNAGLGSATAVAIILDGEAPPQPYWDDEELHSLQRVFSLRGHCEELAVGVRVAVNGELFGEFATNVEYEFMAVVDLEDPAYFPAGPHTSTWTAQAVDEAGNQSPVSAALTVAYNPDPARSIPGRFRGGLGEAIQINTARDARGIRIRVYGLDGELLNILDMQGGPRQFEAEWDLSDAGGRALLDGLIILNIATTFADGEIDYEREVVAIVRD